MHDYDYAVLRLVPDVRAEAFENVGVALHSRTARLCALRVRLPEALPPGLDAALVARFVAGLEAVAAGEASAGPIALLTPSERFHFLTAPRSTVVQVSPVRGGRCEAPAEAFEALFARYGGA